MAADTATRERGIGFHPGSLTGLDWTAMALAAVTGALHLYLFTTEDWIPFLLADLGFFGAILLFLFDVFRYYLYPLGILYTAAQIVGYLLVPLGPEWIGVADKAVQVALIVVLAYRFRGLRAARRARDATT